MAPGAVGPAATRFTDWRYRGMGKPEAPAIAAAARERRRHLASERARQRRHPHAREQLRQPVGSSGFTQGRRTDARDQVGEAWDRWRPHAARWTRADHRHDRRRRRRHRATRRGGRQPDESRRAAIAAIPHRTYVADRHFRRASRDGRVARTTDPPHRRPDRGRVESMRWKAGCRETLSPAISRLTIAVPTRQGFADGYAGSQRRRGRRAGHYAGQVERAHCAYARRRPANGVPPETCSIASNNSPPAYGHRRPTDVPGPVPQLEALTRKPPTIRSRLQLPKAGRAAPRQTLACCSPPASRKWRRRSATTFECWARKPSTIRTRARRDRVNSPPATRAWPMSQTVAVRPARTTRRRSRHDCAGAQRADPARRPRSDHGTNHSEHSRRAHRRRNRRHSATPPASPAHRQSGASSAT